ncbi:hypothetical protein NVP1238A_74 [Vibrio phage 1.238.A._10N.261.52.F10]|uniref:Uncharacterized protein n=2 Tax=Pariacacavirus TaxID=2948856 RepID=A0A2I7RUJ9_9CAUD|nr:hypothetical protein KNT79_gp74 [Vibrio phage 1.238.A._10N.261.52.F10]YP_010093519.1 hypothetical protein KNT80_gp76 [Vibrio phage 1.245.O._10N.261.54.C7]AUR97323.1 hypothetical protein NVP1238A_74 [Vibrio phage 1.238.A._10N.261.52.F10]AUR97417.1 hypothetical protein NVP1238B_75 [Vibrio phage 1.238.B._10N.261.52.F10]AUR97989.1 hypothetical protein NVP1245O_76 [Vibrio phage 1.245.O._10N.261.54.C7]
MNCDSLAYSSEEEEAFNDLSKQQENDMHIFVLAEETTEEHPQQTEEFVQGDMVCLGDPHGERYYFLGHLPQNAMIGVLVSEDKDVFTEPVTTLVRPKDIQVSKCLTEGDAKFSGFATHYENGAEYFMEIAEGDFEPVNGMSELLTAFEENSLFMKIN